MWIGTLCAPFQRPFSQQFSGNRALLRRGNQLEPHAPFATVVVVSIYSIQLQQDCEPPKNKLAMQSNQVNAMSEIRKSRGMSEIRNGWDIVLYSDYRIPAEDRLLHE